MATIGFMLLFKIKTPPTSTSALPIASSSTTSLTNSIVPTSHSPCLADDEYVDYPINRQYPEYQKVAQIPVVISVRNKTTKNVKLSFTVENVPSAESEQLELHKCGVYILREFQQGQLWSRELWRYDYSGQGNKLLILLQTQNGEIIKTGPQFYAYFYIDPDEKYLALDLGPLGSSNQAMIVKNLASPDLPDVLTVTGQDILKAAPSLSQNRSAEPVGWSSDGRYLWGGSGEIDQSNTVYFRINIHDKSNLEVFPMPSDAVYFGPPKLDTGYIIYVYGPPFTGISEETKIVNDEWKKAGKSKSLFLYNLFTKTKILVAASDDPGWYFDEHWLSDTQLQYTLPSGEKKVYTIGQ